MNVRKFSEDHSWWIRLITPPLTVVVGLAVGAYLKDQFFTRAEAAGLLILPAKFEQIQRDVEPLKTLPSRVQSLEERAQVQALTNVRREGQVDEMKNALSTMSAQLSVALSKLDDINRRTARTEDKVDQLTSSDARRP